MNLKVLFRPPICDSAGSPLGPELQNSKWLLVGLPSRGSWASPASCSVVIIDLAAWRGVQ